MVNMNEEFDSNMGNDSDSSYDDMLKDFGAVSVTKQEKLVLLFNFLVKISKRL